MLNVKSYTNKGELVQSDSVFMRKEDFPYILEILDDDPGSVKIHIVMDDKLENGEVLGNTTESGEILFNCAVPKIGAAIGLNEPIIVAESDGSKISIQFLIRNSYENLFEITTSLFRNVEG